MKKIVATLLVLCMLFSLCACSKSNDSAKKADEDNYYIEIKFSNVFQPTEWNYKASEKFAAMVNEKSEGHVKVTYYGQNELDCYGDSVTQAVNGANWIGLEQPDLFADYVGDTAVLVGPMLYANNEEYNYIMDSDPVKDIIARLAEENIHILDTHYSFGFRSVVTNYPNITTPDDLKGVKLRATSSALYTKVVEALGATAATMGFTECLSAISSGVVEGFEGSISTLSGAGAPYELVKCVANTNHLIATRWLFMSEDVYQAMPEKYQKILTDCAYECGMWEQTSCEEDEATQIEMLKQNGVVWNDVDLDAFTAAMNPVFDWIVDTYEGVSPDLHQKLVDLIVEYRKKK